MYILSRVGYALAYIGSLALAITIVYSFWGQADPLLWSISIVFLLVGIPLWMRDPDAKQLKWGAVWSASPAGTIGVSLTAFGTMILLTIVRRYLMEGSPIETWWYYLVMSGGALLLGVGALIRWNPVKLPVRNAAPPPHS